MKKKLLSQKGRDYTVSIALPGSILSNAQSLELRTYLAGQIARALVVFNIDEVIVFNETCQSTASVDTTFRGAGKKSDPNILLGRILQYLECPQYLRKSFFPRHPDLQYAGLLNPLDCPHHMRATDMLPFREGIVVNRPVKDGHGSLVNVGLQKEVSIDKRLKAGTRVTVKLAYKDKKDVEVESACVVPPSQPRTEEGLYWGYTVRLAHTFSAVFTKSPHKHGYDLTIGTSERGTAIDEIELKKFQHLLIVFGGLQGLEASLESDESLNAMDPSSLFHHYINTCPEQGSRTIRTEEALLITMSALRPHIKIANQKG
ncbi:putative methyltransferase C9orf114 homolog [Dendronephthya gigantea]|uniref:putative methyltransferase C9orf114 homolog n=1 Tax=Dendronephthya gigantea TaxID=151771 RepID=UPI00106A0818|nr:putative methyltransferase C9orf114 homolog [Dendronephthya gigantea]